MKKLRIIFVLAIFVAFLIGVLSSSNILIREVCLFWAGLLIGAVLTGIILVIDRRRKKEECLAR